MQTLAEAFSHNSFRYVCMYVCMCVRTSAYGCVFYANNNEINLCKQRQISKFMFFKPVGTLRNNFIIFLNKKLQFYQTRSSGTQKCFMLS